MDQKSSEEERVPLPKDDAAYRRTGKINQQQSKHFNQPSQITMSSASPEPSIISERSRLV